MRSFHVDHVVQIKRSALSLSSHECFSCRARGWKIFWCAFTLSRFNLTRHQTSTWLIYWCNIFLFWDRRDISKSKENNIETNRGKTQKRFYEHNKGVALTRHTRILDQEVGVKFRCAWSSIQEMWHVRKTHSPRVAFCLLVHAFRTRFDNCLHRSTNLKTLMVDRRNLCRQKQFNCKDWDTEGFSFEKGRLQSYHHKINLNLI